MSRFDRKKNSIKYGGGGLNGFIDDSIKSTWFITDDEYDYICENATDDEINYFLLFEHSFSDIKKSMIIVDRLLDEMYN